MCYLTVILISFVVTRWLSGYCSLPSGYCSLLGGYWWLLLVAGVTARYRLLLLVSTFIMNSKIFIATLMKNNYNKTKGFYKKSTCQNTEQKALYCKNDLVLNDLASFAGKCLCWSLFVINLKF